MFVRLVGGGLYFTDWVSLILGTKIQFTTNSGITMIVPITLVVGISKINPSA